MVDAGGHSDAVGGGLWDLGGKHPVAPIPDAPIVDAPARTPRTERLSHEAAAMEVIPVDAQNLGLTDLTAPGLALASSLNPDRARHRRAGRLMLLFMMLPLLAGFVVNLWILLGH